MTFLLRYCINCKKLCGCVKGSTKTFCEDCSKKDTCFIRKNFDYYSKKFLTGTYCKKCFTILKKEDKK